MIGDRRSPQRSDGLAERLSPDSIKAHRTMHGLTKKDLARALNYTPNYIASLERGDLPITEEMATRFDDWLRGLTKTNVYVPVTVRASRADAESYRNVIVLAEPRKCACGCTTRFVPVTPNHIYFPGHAP